MLDDQRVQPGFDDDEYVTQPKLRKMLGDPSPVTFWRWRHNKTMGCPPLKEINGRLYGSRNRWMEWWSKQREIA